MRNLSNSAFRPLCKMGSKQLRRQEGQAIVEYLLMVSLALAMVGIMSKSFRGSVTALWTTFNKEIAAGCPGCNHPRLNPQ